MGSIESLWTRLRRRFLRKGACRPQSSKRTICAPILTSPTRSGKVIRSGADHRLDSGGGEGRRLSADGDGLPPDFDECGYLLPIPTCGSPSKPAFSGRRRSLVGGRSQ